MTKKHSAFFKNAAWQYGLQFVKHLLPLITLPYLARVLEPSGYAVYAYVVAFMQFIQIMIDFGFNLSGTKQIAAAKSNREINQIVGSITQARVCICSICAIVLLVALLAIPIMRENIAYSVLAFIAVCGRGLAPDFVFQGKERMSPITIRYLVSKGTSTLLTFALVHSFLDILWIPVLDIIASTIALIWSFVAAKKIFNVKMILVPFKRALFELKRSALYCFSNMASATFSGFTTLVVGFVFIDSAQISYWSLAMTGLTAVQTLYTPIFNSLYPRMVKSKDFRFALKIAAIALPFLLIGTSAYILLSDWIMLILGGQDYTAGSYIFSYTAPVLVFSFYGMLFGWPILGAMGGAKEMAISTVIAGISSILSLLLLWVFGEASLLSFSVVRVFVELLLMCLRMLFCLKYKELLKKTV